MKPSPPSSSSSKTSTIGKPLACQSLSLRSKRWVLSTSSPLIPTSSRPKLLTLSFPSPKVKREKTEEPPKKLVTITLITTEMPKLLSKWITLEITPSKPSLVSLWLDSMSSFSTSTPPWMTSSKLRSEPVEILSLSSKNLRKRPTSSRSNSTDMRPMPLNSRTISSSPRTWKPEPRELGKTPSPLLSKLRLSSRSTETSTWLKSIDSEMTSKLSMRSSPSSSKNSKVLMTSSETNNMTKSWPLMMRDSPLVCSETLKKLVSTPDKPTGKVPLPPTDQKPRDHSIWINNNLSYKKL